MSTLTEQRAAALKAASDIIQLIKKEDRDFTDEERETVETKHAEVVALDVKISGQKLVKDVLDLGSADDEPDDDADKPAKSLGHHFVKHTKAGLARLKNGERLSISAPEYKAAADPQSSPTLTTIESVNIPQIDYTIVQAFRRRPFLADLLGSGSMTAPALTYFVEGAREGNFTTVAEGAAKPSIHYVDPTPVTDTLKKIAGHIKLTDEMMEDFDFLVSEINTRLLYDLAIFEESQLLEGDGLATNVLGLLERSGVQTETAADNTDNADAIFRAMMKVQTATGLDADGLAINPIDYQQLRLGKDANDQYYGGGYFQGQYGNQPGVDWQLPVWGNRTVVTAGLTANTALVGAFSQGATVYRKGGVRVESTNSNENDFIHNRVTVRVEERVALAVRRPAAFVIVTLSDTAPA